MMRFTTALLLPCILLSGGSEFIVIDGSAVVVDETFVTPRQNWALVDSPAIWTGQAGETWIVATGKLTSRLYVSDAATGAHIRTVGRRGSRLGEFSRPNGIAIAGDLALVVERDNHRVQVLRLPAFTPVGSFGEETLSKPYGVAVQSLAKGEMIVFITDDYQKKNGRDLTDRDLGERVKRYRVAESDEGLVSTYLGAFGDTVGAGRLIGVESV